MRKRWTRKAKNKRNKQIIMCSLIGLMFLMVCGYAAFSTNLSLKAKGNIVKKKTASEILLESVVDQGDGLYKDIYEDDRYIYRGKNPNNYIIFNNEVWRIISVEKDGVIKILRNKIVSNQVWDNSDSQNWTKPATIHTYLNETYFNKIVNNVDKIIEYTWPIGLLNSGNTDLAGQISTEKLVTWEGKIGLISYSDYLRANSNYSLCGNDKIHYENYATCSKLNWMYISGTYWWTITPLASSSNYVVNISRYGNATGGNVENTLGVRPAIYLSSDITLSGAGTEKNPYVITN